MSSLTRQNALLVAESWTRIYESMENQDFRAYDFDNIVSAVFNYLKSTYPSEYNDYVASSEFVTKVEILAWLSQNIAFRVDLNTRENFLATAERRDSLIRLAQNVGYKMNRVRSASGGLKLKTIRTTQEIIDSNGINLKNKTIIWNDPRDEDWFERFILILNKAFTNRTQFGTPLSSNTTDGLKISQYRFNSAAPLGGSYRFTSTVNGVTLPFDLYNGLVDSTDGTISEYSPDPTNAFHILYLLDGNGYNSNETGFFLPFKQGNLTYHDEIFQNPEVLRTVTLSSANVNNDDFFVQQMDQNGNVIADWTKVDTVFGEGVSFNTISGSIQNVYEVDTLTNDTVRVKFGDGTFGAIPTGIFRFWYRTANPTPSLINSSAIQNTPLTIPYTSSSELYQLTMTASLQTNVSNGVSTESNFDIRTRVGKVFYTQNRMVNAQDYNNFYLKDNSIQKVQTVNRSFAGQSRYARLNDPTGLYQNIKHVAEDGRIYEDATSSTHEYSGDTSILSVSSLITQYIKPLIKKSDKKTLYQTKYSEIVLTNPYVWTETSHTTTQSLGNITLSGVAQSVGNTATGNLVYFDTDSIMRFTSPLGSSVNIDRVIDSGTASNGIVLKDVVTSGETIYSVLPALRNTFNSTELNKLIARINSKLDFAIYWNQITQSWDFIDSEDIDRASDFSVTNMGDTTKSGKDASWMIRFSFSAGSTSSNADDLWTITDRGLSLFFESANEVDFAFQNSEPTIDPETGKPVWDTIKLLETNESRDSLYRRGLTALTTAHNNVSVYSFSGDSTTLCFKTQQVPLESEKTVVMVNGVYQVENLDYTITSANDGYSVCFTTAPAANTDIEVYYNSEFVHAGLSVIEVIGDNVTDEFDLGVSEVRSANVLSHINGVAQNANVDYGIGQIGTNNSLIYDQVLQTGMVGSIFSISGVDNNIFTRNNFIGDGSTKSFTVPDGSQSSDTILVAIDGITQMPSTYSVTPNASSSVITFNTAPATATRVRITSIVNPSIARTKQYEYTGDGTTTTFAISDSTLVPSSGAGVMVYLDGVFQNGPYSSTPTWSITNSNNVLFTTAPVNGETIQIYYIAGALGIKCLTSPSELVLTSTGPTPLNVSSTILDFIGTPVSFTPTDVLRHADGYINKNGLAIEPIDADLDGAIDTPFIFRDFVLQDGSDIVLWQRIKEFGFSIWEPIGDTTSPKGTYGSSANTGIAVGDALDPILNQDGDIHFDRSTSTWLVADSVSNTWITAPDQTGYKYAIGRGNLRFMWTHYAPEGNRIDPSKSNIMNVYILTTGYNTAYRNWLSQDGVAADEPSAETSASLKIAYSNFEDYKPISDAVIYYPMSYLPLFGSQAISEYQATFKIIQTTGSTLSEADLKLNVLSAIDTYFQIERWSSGESFYFTELVAFVHAMTAPDLQSMVIVPKSSTQAFGRMFQIRSEPTQLFISAASPEDISVVQNFSDVELRIGTLV